MLIGCASNEPNLGPASWYRGTSTIDPPNATVFGPGGDVAIEWQRMPYQNLWIWRENRASGWNQQTVWEASPTQPGTFNAAVSSGAWSGQVTMEDWQSTGLYSPAGWHGRMILTDGSGQLTCTAQTADPGGGGDEMQGSIASPSPLFAVWITWEWIRTDGSVGARMSQKLTACNESEFIAAVQRLGGTVPVPNR